jgi:hypothetical protein
MLLVSSELSLGINFDHAVRALGALGAFGAVRVLSGKVDLF